MQFHYIPANMFSAVVITLVMNGIKVLLFPGKKSARVGDSVEFPIMYLVKPCAKDQNNRYPVVADTKKVDCIKVHSPTTVYSLTHLQLVRSQNHRKELDVFDFSIRSFTHTTGLRPSSAWASVLGLGIWPFSTLGTRTKIPSFSGSPNTNDW